MKKRGAGWMGVLAMMSLSACATAHDGFYATPIALEGKPAASPLAISSAEAEELAGPALGVVEVTFENPTQQWMRLSNLQIDFGDDARNRAVEIPSGNDLVTWGRAVQQREAIAQTNRSNTLAALAITGALFSVVSPSNELSLVGDLVSLGSLGMLAADDVQRGITAVQRSSLYPETHLLAPDLSVPPGLFVKRWILLHTKDDRLSGPITSFRLDYQTGDGQKRAARLTFRHGTCQSLWQGHFCRESPRRRHQSP